MSTRAIVSIVKVENSIYDGVRKAIDLIGGIPFHIHEGTKVLIKPNLMRAETSTVGTTTNIELIRSVGTIVLEKGAQVIIGEASGNQYDTEDIYSFLHLREYLKDFEIRDLDRDPIIPVEIKGARALKKVGIAESVLKADILISLPVMKTHNSTLFTGGMKNLMGILPQREKWNMHLSGIHQALVDLNRFVTSHLIIMDALVAMEGWGPAMGYPVNMNLILAGTDVVAVDTVAAKIMDIDVKEVEHLIEAGKQDVGIADLTRIEIKGENIDNIKRPFRRPKGLKVFEVFGKTQYRIGRFFLNNFNYDIRPLINKLSLFHLPKPKINYMLCKTIGDCSSVCPQSAIHVSSFPFIDYSKCSRCMACYNACTHQAILISRLPSCILKVRNLFYSIKRKI